MTVLITGGVGFIGTNLASRLLAAGERVRILDSLARPGVERNVAWLSSQYPQTLDIDIADVRDALALERAMRDVTHVFHLAAQVAVTTSLDAPMHDFEVNARGTLNVLESARRQPTPPSLLFTSTNKVYGALDDLPLRVAGQRYEPVDPALRTTGIGEARPLDFHSPYGCSKGAADQYVLDYARCYGLRSTVFRMSCIYGPHQLGTEDQGWVAHFLLRARAGLPLTVYGDGMQVRDILHVHDLLDALLEVMAQQARGEAAPVNGRAFNIGGGPDNTISLLELLDLLRERHDLAPSLEFAEARTGDQRYFVADTRQFTEATGWSPRIAPTVGIAQLLGWFAAQPRRDDLRRLPLSNAASGHGAALEVGG